MLTCEYCVKLKACSAKVPADVGEKNPEYEGERFCPDFKKFLTNADHIRAMSDEELGEMFANFLRNIFKLNKIKAELEDTFEADMIDWLKQPFGRYEQK